MAFVNRKFNGELKNCFFTFINTEFGNLLSSSDFFVMSDILKRTLGFGHDWFTYGFLTVVDDKAGSIPIIATHSKTALYRSLSSLCESNFIYKIPQTRPAIYIVNSPAIILAILHMQKLCGIRHKKSASYIKLANSIYSYHYRNEVHLPKKLNIPTGVYMDIETAINKARMSTEGALMRKDERRINKQNVTPKDVQYFFEKICTDLELKCYTGDWTKKDYGQCKNFINSCKTDGINVYQKIYDVCKYWAFFRQGVLVRDNATEILLGEVINFQEFYTYHKKIHHAIMSYSDKWDDAESQVTECVHIDLDEWSRKRKEGL